MAGFKAILGHEQIIEHLQNAVTMDKVSHAYIINGPDKSGKMMLAEAFAQTLECEKLEDVVKNAAQPSDVEPCMECHSCKQAMTKNQPDIIYVRHEKPNTISVDDIRTQVNNDIVIKPYSSRYKIYMIDEAEKMNEQAQNALLKTIEMEFCFPNTSTSLPTSTPIFPVRSIIHMSMQIFPRCGAGPSFVISAQRLERQRKKPSA